MNNCTYNAASNDILEKISKTVFINIDGITWSNRLTYNEVVGTPIDGLTDSVINRLQAYPKYQEFVYATNDNYLDVEYDFDNMKLENPELLSWILKAYWSSIVPENNGTLYIDESLVYADSNCFCVRGIEQIDHGDYVTESDFEVLLTYEGTFLGIFGDTNVDPTDKDLIKSFTDLKIKVKAIRNLNSGVKYVK